MSNITSNLYKKNAGNRDINIIYFIWINENRDWKSIIGGQINDMKRCGILSQSKLHVVLCANTNYYLNQCSNYIFSLLSDIDDLVMDINTFLENNFEYQGIKKIYDLANEYPDKYYLYLHSKGMFNKTFDVISSSRFIDERILTHTILNNWRDVIKILKDNKNIVRIGMFPSEGGWIWFNFFWSRGDYIRSCEEPKLTNDRYYYESWICNSIMRSWDSYSLYSHSIKKFNGTDATNLLHELRKKY